MDTPVFDAHPQMALVEWDQEVETLAAKASAEPFAYGVCHGRPHGNSKDSHPEVRHRLVQFPREDAVPIMDQESIGVVAGQCLSELL
jgi:hypothetical protein